jgi:hypothetical protein
MEMAYGILKRAFASITLQRQPNASTEEEKFYEKNVSMPPIGMDGDCSISFIIMPQRRIGFRGILEIRSHVRHSMVK